MPGKTVVILITGAPPTLVQQSGQEKVRTWMQQHNIDFKEIDGGVIANKPIRDELFGISGVRGDYPQVFLLDADADTTEFVGRFEDIQSLIESNEIPADVLAKNPDIRTFDSVFADAKAE